MSPKRWFVLLSVLLALNLVAIIAGQNSDDAAFAIPIYYMFPIIFSVCVLVTLTRKAGWIHQLVALALVVSVLTSSWLILSAERQSINECRRPKTNSNAC